MGKVDQGVFSRWIAAHYFGRPLGYFGHGGMGHQVRDFLHVTDLTELISWQIAHIGDVSGRTFNVGGGRDRSLSLAELTGLAARLAGRETRIDSVESESPNDVRWYISDPRHAIDACHWSPRRSLEVIAEDVLRWLHDERTVLSPYFE
jgi:CDP-paratose 2-epimerase